MDPVKVDLHLDICKMLSFSSFLASTFIEKIEKYYPKLSFILKELFLDTFIEYFSEENELTKMIQILEEYLDLDIQLRLVNYPSLLQETLGSKDFMLKNKEVIGSGKIV